MNLHRILILGLYCVLLAQPAMAQQWETLFNGKDLTGWEFVGNGLADVENGEIALRWDHDNPGGGWLMSTEQFDNFRVQADYYAPGPTNSGFAIRYQGERGEDPAFYGYEIQIFNDQSGTQNNSGAIYQLARAFWKGIKPNDWNTFDVTAIGNHIVVKINGEKVSEVHDRRSLRGRIGFQSHDEKTEVRVRNVRIQRLPVKTDIGPQIEDWMRRSNKGETKTLFNGWDLKAWNQVGQADWSVEDGAIVGKNPGPTGGFLMSEQRWKNFYLKVKFKIQIDHNSGVWVRWDGTGDALGLDNAIEVNVYDQTDDTWENSTGAVASFARAYNKRISFDDWNEMEVFAFGDHFCIYVNGVKASEGHVPAETVRSGYVGMQIGPRVPTGELDSIVSFKDIVIKGFDVSRWDKKEIPFMGY